MTHSGAFFVQCDTAAAFELLSTPERFAPLLPDFESMAVRDATHFMLRTVLAIGRVSGHINLSMEIIEALRPCQVVYQGQGMIAGSPLHFKVCFRIAPVEQMTEVQWRGEVGLSGPLSVLAGDILDAMGRNNFERMAESLQQGLNRTGTGSLNVDSIVSDYEI